MSTSLPEKRSYPKSLAERISVWTDQTRRTADLMHLFSKALQDNNLSTIEQIVQAEHCVDMPLDEEGKTPLMLACQYGRHEIVQRLIAEGADVNRAISQKYIGLRRPNREFGKVALDYALGQPAILKMLLAQKACVQDVLAKALCSHGIGALEILSALKEAGVDFSSLQIKGRSIMETALDFESLESQTLTAADQHMIRHLIRLGCHPETIINGQKLIFLLLEKSPDVHFILDLIHENNLDINLRDVNGDTLLMKIADSINNPKRSVQNIEAAIKELRTEGADPGLKNAHAETAYAIALRHGGASYGKFLGITLKRFAA